MDIQAGYLIIDRNTNIFEYYLQQLLLIVFVETLSHVIEVLKRGIGFVV